MAASANGRVLITADYHTFFAWKYYGIGKEDEKGDRREREREREKRRKRGGKLPGVGRKARTRSHLAASANGKVLITADYHTFFAWKYYGIGERERERERERRERENHRGKEESYREQARKALTSAVIWLRQRMGGF